jgi:hypothetical protein
MENNNVNRIIIAKRSNNGQVRIILIHVYLLAIFIFVKIVNFLRRKILKSLFED